jgi:hypothetical protein
VTPRCSTSRPKSAAYPVAVSSIRCWINLADAPPRFYLKAYVNVAPASYAVLAGLVHRGIAAGHIAGGGTITRFPKTPAAPAPPRVLVAHSPLQTACILISSHESSGRRPRDSVIAVISSQGRQASMARLGPRRSSGSAHRFAFGLRCLCDHRQPERGKKTRGSMSSRSEVTIDLPHRAVARSGARRLPDYRELARVFAPTSFKHP